MNDPGRYPAHWYAVAESTEISRKPVSLKRFGLDLVFWRDPAGRLVAMNDLCPHRSVKLSAGAVKGDRIECPFHGFQYGMDGLCRYVPEIRRDAPGLSAKTYVCTEEHGFVWLWWPGGQPDTGFVRPWFSEVAPDMERASLTQTWSAPVTRVIENQLDYAHLPFLHRRTIGRGFDPASPVEFELGDGDIRFFPSPRGKQGPYIAFKMPNLWLNKITDRFVLVLAFAPVDEGHTKMYLRTYQSMVKLPVLRRAAAILMGSANRFILREDRRVVETHPAGIPSTEASKERLFPSDRAIRHFRALWQGAPIPA